MSDEDVLREERDEAREDVKRYEKLWKDEIRRKGRAYAGRARKHVQLKAAVERAEKADADVLALLEVGIQDIREDARAGLDAPSMANLRARLAAVRALPRRWRALGHDVHVTQGHRLCAAPERERALRGAAQARDGARRTGSNRRARLK